MNWDQDDDSEADRMNWEAFLALPVEFRRRIKEDGAALSAAMDLLRAEIEREEADLAVQEFRRELDQWPTYDRGA